MENEHFSFRAAVLTLLVGALALIGYSFTNAQSSTNCSRIALGMDKTSYASGETINLTYRCEDNLPAASLQLHICLPGGTCEERNQYVGVATNAPGGSFTIGTGAFTTPGTYYVRTCVKNVAPTTTSSISCDGGVATTAAFQIASGASGSGTYPYPQTPIDAVAGTCQRSDGTTYPTRSDLWCEPGHNITCSSDAFGGSYGVEDRTYRYCRRSQATCVFTMPSNINRESCNTAAVAYIGCTSTMEDSVQQESMVQGCLNASGSSGQGTTTTSCQYVRPSNPTRASCETAVTAYIGCTSTYEDNAAWEQMVQGCVGAPNQPTTTDTTITTTQCQYVQPSTPTRSSCETAASNYIGCTSTYEDNAAWEQMVQGCVGTTSTTLKTCGAGEGYGTAMNMNQTPSCQVPYWCWGGGDWVQKSDFSSSGMNCTSFRVEQLDAMRLWAQTFDPVQLGAWYWPIYPAGTLSYKYDAASDSLVSCQMSEMHYDYSSMRMPSEYQGFCTAMSEAHKPAWLAKFRSEKKMFDSWKQASDTLERDDDNDDDERFCIQVTAHGWNPETKVCKSFSTPCAIPNGWEQVDSCEAKQGDKMKICPAMPTVSSCKKGETMMTQEFPGCGTYSWCVPEKKKDPIPNLKGLCPLMPSVAFCGEKEVMVGSVFRGCGIYTHCVDAATAPYPTDQFLCKRQDDEYLEQLMSYRFYFEDLLRQHESTYKPLKLSNEVLAAIKQGQQVVERAQKKGNAAYNGTCTQQALADVDTDLKWLKIDILPTITEAAEGTILVGQRCQALTEEWVSEIVRLRKDAERFEKRGEKDFVKKIRDAADQSEALLPKAKAVCALGDPVAIQDVYDERGKILQTVSELFVERDGFYIDDFVIRQIEEIRSGISFMRERMEKKSLERACKKVEEYFTQVEALLDDAEEAWGTGDHNGVSQILEKAGRYRDITFEAARQCGLAEDFDEFKRDEKRVIDPRALIEGIQGIDDQAIEKIVDRVVEKILGRVEVLMNETVKNFLAKAQQLQEQTLQRITVGVENLQKVLKDDQSKLQELLASKEKIVEEANQAVEELRASNVRLSASLKTELEGHFSRAAEVVWCGENADRVNQKVKLFQNLLGAGELNASQVSSFGAFLDSAYARNPELCVEENVSKYKDPNMSPEQWFFVHFHGDDPAFKGKFDAQGRPLGIVEHNRQALWIEGAMVVARTVGVRGVDRKCDVPAAIPGATQVPYGACLLIYFYEEDISFPEHSVSAPMTRAELAEVIVNLAGEDLPISGTEEAVAEYTDVEFDGPHGAAIAAVIANKIMVGKGEGVFKPNDVPTRAEVAAVKDRLREVLEFTKK